MIRTLSALLSFAILAFAAPSFADPLTLRARIEVNGPAITLGDVFDGAGSEAQRAIAPAPPAGQIAQLNTQFLAAAAQSAGHSWTPPSGMNVVRVVRPGGARATVGPASSNHNNGGGAVADAAVQRGQTVMVVYRTPGVQLTTRARALEDGAVGQTIRLTNLTSNRTVDAVVTGPGAASANP